MTVLPHQAWSNLFTPGVRLNFEYLRSVSSFLFCPALTEVAKSTVRRKELILFFGRSRGGLVIH